MEMLKTANKQIELNYPEVSPHLTPSTIIPCVSCKPAWITCEVMGKCFIIHAPMAFRAIWAVVSLWLPARTLLKIEVHTPRILTLTLLKIIMIMMPATRVTFDRWG